jgi:hypothetical protein
MRITMLCAFLILAGCADEAPTCSDGACNAACGYEGHERGYCAPRGTYDCTCCGCYDPGSGYFDDRSELVGSYDGAPRCFECEATP